MNTASIFKKICLALGVFFLVMAGANAIPLQVIRYEPAPNYELTKSVNDGSELTDGQTQKHPMWLYPGAVGWKEYNIIRIDFKISTSLKNGILKLHTDCGSGAGAFFPQRIDAYSSSTSTWTHVGEVGIAPLANCDQQKWLELSVSNISSNLTLVIHANGRFIFFDEIIFEENPAPAPPIILGAQQTAPSLGEKSFPDLAVSQVQLAATALITDSMQRLKQAQAAYASQQTTDGVSHIKEGASTGGNTSIPIAVWQQDPWASFDTWYKANLPIPSLPNRITVSGINTETQPICIGVLGLSSSSPTSVILSPTLPTNAQVRFREVKSVTAANGIKVYDRLANIQNNVLSLNTQEPSYIWADIDLKSFSVGSHDIYLKLKYSNGEVSIPIKVDVVKAPAITPLKVVSWAYPDSRIWQNRQLALQELLSAGTNVFVIAPGFIPGVKLDNTWSTSIVQEFDKQISMYAPYGDILLFMGWDRVNPLTNDTARSRFPEWLIKISNHLDTLGVPKKNWGFYPFDEPHGDLVASLQDVVSRIHAVNPEFRVYANPIPHATLSENIVRFALLKDQISIWQPDWQVLNTLSGAQIRQTKNSLWLYAVPKEPAKLASPLQFYRSLAWQAWRYGATGIGFWSFSDVSGTSARDDNDGNRPDYAVVYEPINDQGIESSRRWEAFKQGVRDYQILANGSIAREEIMAPEFYDTTKMAALRAKALDKIRSSQ